MHFLLWTKGSHEKTNFDTFKCCEDNLTNSSSDFPNQKSVFLQILRDASLSWNIPLCTFLCQRCILCKKGTNQSGNGSDFLVVGSKFSKFFSFLKENINLYSNFVPLFGIMRHIYSILFLAKTLYTFSKSSLSKYKFGTNHIVSATNVQKAYLSWQRRVMQSLKKKLTCCFKYGRRNLVTFNPCTQKFEDFTSAGYFCPKYRRFEQKKNTEELFFMTLNSNAKFE